jgi:hypothetical protein
VVRRANLPLANLVLVGGVGRIVEIGLR